MKLKNYIKKNTKALVLILCLNLIQFTPNSVLAGTDGGGGGSFKVTKKNYEVSAVEYDIATIRKHVRAFFRANKPNRKSYGGGWSFPLSKEKFNLLYDGKPNIFDVIDQAHLTINKNWPCFYKFKIRDGYAYKDKNGQMYVCLSQQSINSKYNKKNSKANLIALAAHEFSHLIDKEGLNDVEAESLQAFIEERLEFNEFPDSLRDNGIAFSSYLQTALSELNNEIFASSSNLCSLDKIDQITSMIQKFQSALQLNNIKLSQLAYFEDQEIISFLIVREKWTNVLSLCGAKGIIEGLARLENPFTHVFRVREIPNSAPLSVMSALEYVDEKYSSYENPHPHRESLLPIIRHITYASRSREDKSDLFLTTPIRNLAGQQSSEKANELVKTEITECISLLRNNWPTKSSLYSSF